MKREALFQLKTFLKDQKLDFFLLPNSDEFFSEYLPEHEKRIEYLTGFTGSNATVIFGQEKSYFFTDGRYILQANSQLDLDEFEIFNVAEKSVLMWLEENFSAEKKLALDAKLTSLNLKKSLLVILDAQRRGSREIELQRSSTLRVKDDDNMEGGAVVFLEENPVDKIWKNRPSPKNSAVFFLDEKVCGLDSISKRKQVLQGFEGDAMIITKPENLCWLLNIRSEDVEFTPLLLAYGILFKSGEIDLFVDEKRCAELEFQKVNLLQPNCFDLRIGVLAKNFKKIQIDASTTNYWLYELLQKNNFEITEKKDPIEILKSVKNKIEIAGAIKAHELDGLALTKFLFWLENAGEIDEILAEEKLLELRKESPDFFSPSFATIAGFASNGAVIHYRATKETNKKIHTLNHPPLEGGSEKTTSAVARSSDPGRGRVLLESRPELDPSLSQAALLLQHCFPRPSLKGRVIPQSDGNLLLIDSGGQYLGKDFCGTTDVTRTIAIGKPSAEMIENFTRVLKGHIAIARAKFPIGTTGSQLDALARNHLWQAGLDYDHGTGHGVGSFLSVHEGPQGISKRAHQPLLPGMILSNEPGFYKAGEYGIRIENLLLVEKCGEKFLQFRTLTLAPFDLNLIDFKMLTWPERNWLCNYHQEILNKLSPHLDLQTREFLQKILTSFRRENV